MKNTTIHPKRLALIGMIIAVCVVLRIYFSAILNVQPITAIFIIIVLTLGITDGLLVMAGTLILSNLLGLGLGPWVFYQLFAYSVILFIMWLLKPIYQSNKINRYMKQGLLASISFLLGMLYGFIVSLFAYNVFGYAHFWVYYLQGVPFDFSHALSNVLFFILLEPIFSNIFKRLNK